MSEDDPEVAAIKIRNTALEKGSTDNISVCVIQFPGKYTPNLSGSSTKEEVNMQTVEPHQSTSNTEEVC